MEQKIIKEEGESATLRYSELQPKQERIRINPVEVVLSESPSYQRDVSVNSRGSVFMEPAGWLICIEGPDFGKSFPLKEGRNHIGRSDTMDVVMKNDLMVSREGHAWIEYREEERAFWVSVGEVKKMVYLNDELLFRPCVMEKQDILSLGESSLMLIPCCNESFSWKSARSK